MDAKWWSDYRKRIRRAAKRAGMCPYHPKRKAEPGKTLCVDCLKSKRSYEKAQRAMTYKPEDNGVCPICRRTEENELVQDQNRRTGEPRGRICTGCHAAIGFFREDLKTLKRALLYLRFFNGGNLSHVLSTIKDSTVSSTPNQELNYKSDSRRAETDL